MRWFIHTPKTTHCACNTWCKKVPSAEESFPQLLSWHDYHSSHRFLSSAAHRTTLAILDSVNSASFQQEQPEATSNSWDTISTLPGQPLTSFDGECSTHRKPLAFYSRQKLWLFSSFLYALFRLSLLKHSAL